MIGYKGLKNILRKYKFFFFLAAAVLAVAVWWNSSSDYGAFNFVFGKENGLKVENRKVNVLLLGVAGGTHDGPNLTDTIMVVSYDVDTHSVTLISLPRDLWLDENKAKVNALYQIGLNKGNGLELAKKEIGKALGISIPYAIRVDFSGFVKAIDLVGGLDVDIPQSFDDWEYPVPGKEDELCGYQEKDMDIDEGKGKELNIPVGNHKVLFDPDNKIATASAEAGKGIDYSPEQIRKFFSCRFEHISFKKGMVRLDGETSLKFVRSRHGTNNEGSDFARSKRQQLVLQAFKEKTLSLDTITDLQKLMGLIQTFGASIDTDIPEAQYPEFAKIVKKVNSTKNLVIDSNGKEPLLVTPSAGDYGGAWVLIPPDNDFTKIHQFVDSVLSSNPSAP